MADSFGHRVACPRNWPDSRSRLHVQGHCNQLIWRGPRVRWLVADCRLCWFGNNRGNRCQGDGQGRSLRRCCLDCTVLASGSSDRLRSQGARPDRPGRRADRDCFIRRRLGLAADDNSGFRPDQRPPLPVRCSADRPDIDGWRIGVVKLALWRGYPVGSSKPANRSRHSEGLPSGLGDPHQLDHSRVRCSIGHRWNPDHRVQGHRGRRKRSAAPQEVHRVGHQHANQG